MGIYLPQIFRGNTAGTTKYMPQGQAIVESAGQILMLFQNGKIMRYELNGPAMRYGTDVV